MGLRQGDGGVGLEAVEFSEHLGEGGDDQEKLSQQVEGLIQGLEEISQQPVVVSSQVEDEEANFRLSNEVAQLLEKIEQEHQGGLLTPDTSENHSEPEESSDADQVSTPVLSTLGEEEKDPRNARHDKMMVLEKLVDNLRKSKVKDINLDKGSSTLKNYSLLSKDEDDNNNKGSEKRGREESDLGKVKVNYNVNVYQ